MEKTHKECHHCFCTLPIERFRFDRGKRRGKCKACEHDYQRQWRAQRRDQAINGAITPLTWRSARPSEVYLVVSRMIDKFGGVSGLCEAWHAAIRRAEASGDHLFVVRSVRVLMTLLDKYEREATPDVSDMSVADLKGVVHGEVVAMIKQQPEIVLRVAEDLGWRVEAPSPLSPQHESEPGPQ